MMPVSLTPHDRCSNLNTKISNCQSCFMGKIKEDNRINFLIHIPVKYSYNFPI